MTSAVAIGRPLFRDEHGHFVRRPLTDREFVYLSLIADGRLPKEIARDLGITEKAVEARLAKARKRLGAVNTPHAVALLIRGGKIRPSQPPALATSLWPDDDPR